MQKGELPGRSYKIAFPYPLTYPTNSIDFGGEKCYAKECF
jgi:hypothetical protein